jgi:hypothetical protein
LFIFKIKYTTKPSDADYIHYDLISVPSPTLTATLCLNILFTAVAQPGRLRRGIILHGHRAGTSVVFCLQNQVALDTHRKTQITPAKQTFNKSVKIKAFLYRHCWFTHYSTKLLVTHTIYCQIVGSLMNNEMEYRKLPRKTEDNHEKPQPNS